MTRALVAYASKHGGTAEIAETIADFLRNTGVEAEARPAASVRDVDGFDAVIVGSAVYMNRWQGDALDVLKRLEHAQVPVWMFSSGPTGGTADSDAKVVDILAAQPAAPGEAGKRGARLGARGHATFGGRVNDEMRGLLERWMPHGDWRDFDAVRAWAAHIACELQPG
jgi:menaquinone-dependent protoporphyrinogen oxidase